MMDAEIPAATQSPRPTAPTRPRDEIARLGKEIYKRDILPQVEADHFGEYVAIDVETGDWAVADTTRGALDRLRAAAPAGHRRLDGARRVSGAAQLRGRVPAEDWVIEGVVNAAHEAVIALHLQGPEGRTRDIEAVVDTGYSGFLTLPAVLVAELGLPFAYTGQAFLANDDEVSFDVHDVTAVGRTTETYQG